MSAGEGLAPADEVAESALAAAAGTGCVAIVHDDSRANVRFARNAATTNGIVRSRHVTIVSFDERSEGTAVGVASRSGGGDVAELVEAARAVAKEASPAEDAAPLLPGAAEADFALEPEETSLEVFAPFLGELEAAFGAARGEGRVLAGYAEHEVSTVYLATSTGARRRYLQPTGSLELVARSEDGGRSAWAARGSADFSGVSVLELDAALRRRLEWAERRVELPAGRYEVVMPPDAVADLVIELAWAMSGREAEDGGTVFSRPGGRTALGERLFELPFELSADPRYPGLECRPFLATGHSSSDVSVFDNGADLSPLAYVRGGTLERLTYHRAGAERSGTQFTAPVDNLVLSCPGGTKTLDELVASSERALLLTCLWYIREVDPETLLLTGLTRDGVYLVEHGEVTGAVNNFRFNQSPLDLLAHATEVGATTRALSREWGEWENRTAMPPLRVADFNMSSVSPAS